MNQKEIQLNITSDLTQNAVKSLMKMNDAVTYVDDSNRDATFNQIIKEAYYYATQVELDFKDIDKQIQDALLVLLLEAKLAYDFFCKGCEDAEVKRLLTFTNHCANERLMSLKN